MDKKDLKKIIIMSELAIYDKDHRGKDDKVLRYFKGDYVYRKNIDNRLGFYLAFAILIIIKSLSIVFIDNIFLDYELIFSSLTNYLIFAFFILILATIVGTCIYSREYDEAEYRRDRYDLLLEKLDTID